MTTISRLQFALPLLVAAVLGSVSVGGSPASAASSELFKSPSGNINCAYFPPPIAKVAVVTCEVSTFSGKAAPRPDDCDLDWVASATVGRTGKVSAWSCQGDTIAGANTKAIAYGATWSKDGFTCVSSAAGMRCSAKNGHGFSVSKTAVTKF
jgi:hypothetical protein